MSRLADPQVHDDLLNYRLKRVVTLGGAPAIRVCEGKFGVARSEWRVVAALVEEGPRSPTDLALRTGMEIGRVSLLISRLIRKALVERAVAAGDRRRAALRATAAGHKLYAELFPQLAAINRRLMSVLDCDEAAVLDRCLAKLTAHAQAIYDSGGGVEVKTDRRLGGAPRVWTKASRQQAAPTNGTSRGA